MRKLLVTAIASMAFVSTSSIANSLTNVADEIYKVDETKTQVENTIDDVKHAPENLTNKAENKASNKVEDATGSVTNSVDNAKNKTLNKATKSLFN